MPETTPKHLTRERGSSVLSHDPVLVVESAIAVLAIVLAMTMVLAAVPDGQRTGKPPDGGVVGVELGDATGTPSAGSQPTRTTAAAPTATLAAPPAGGGRFGNPVRNWSFEQDLNGWQAFLGVGTTAPQGRTSGSCASVRARQPGQVGLRQTGVIADAVAGSRYVAKAWVRSAAAGLKVTLRLVGTGTNPERSQATTTTTAPGLAWRSVIVDHTVTAAGTDLGVEITAGGVPAGEALLVDEVTVRQG
jgi:hypothetical protein